MGLGWLFADDLAGLEALDEDELWPDTRQIAADVLPTLRRMLGPLLRALLLAGYRVIRLDIVRAGVAPTSVGVDDVTLAPSVGGAPDPSQSHAAGAGVIISVTDLTHERAWAAVEDGAWTEELGSDPAVERHARFSHGLEVPTSDPGLWPGLTTLVEEGEMALAQHVELWDDREWFGDDWRTGIGDQAGRVTADLERALLQRLEGEDGTLRVDVTPRDKAGLLWLVNPLFWFERDVTFPGDDFIPDKVPPTDATELWPAVLSEQAKTLDPVAVREALPPPDPPLSLLTEIAGQAWRETQDPERFMLGQVRSAARLVRTLAHDLLGQLLAGNRVRHFLDAAVEFGAEHRGGADRSVIDGVRGRSWLEALLAMADTGMIRPAGYPLDAVGVAGPPIEVAELVTAVLHPGTEETFERIVLEVDGAGLPDPGEKPLPPWPAVVLSKTHLCTAELVDAVAWDYALPSEGQLLRIVVVAGPGVDIYPQEGLGDIWELEAFRVWDYASVPPRGARVQPEVLMSPFVLSWEPTDLSYFLRPNRQIPVPMFGVSVYPLPDGVAFEYPVPSTPEEAPSVRITAKVNPLGGSTRIAYDATFGHERGSGPSPMIDPFVPSIAAVTLWVSEDVEVKRENLEATPAPGPWLKEEAWRLPDPASVPLQGATLPVAIPLVATTSGPPVPEPDAELPEAATRIEFPPPDVTWFNYSLDALDVFIGFIPVLGDIIDGAELVQSIFTGKDKWGRPVTFYDQLLMSVALAPFVSKALLKGAERTVKGVRVLGEDVRFLGNDLTGYPLSRSQHRPLLDFVDAKRGLPRADEELLDLAGTSSSFHRFDPARQQKVLDGLRQLGRFTDLAERLGREVGEDLAEYSFEIVDLLTDGRPNYEFWLPALQQPYRRWLRANGHPASTEATVEAWIAATSQTPRAILEALLGNATVKRLRAGDKAIRSPKLTNWKAKGIMTFAKSAKDAAHYSTPAGVREILHAAQNLGKVFADSGRVFDVDLPEEELPYLASVTEKLLRKLSPTGSLDDLDPGVLTEIMGSKTLAPEDLAELLMRGCKLVDDRLKAIADATDIPITAETYLTFTGHRSFFQDQVTGSGFQYSSLWEVMGAGEEYARRILNGEADPAKSFTLQVATVSGQKGPDMARKMKSRVKQRKGQDCLQIVESKSVAHIWLTIYSGQSKAAVQARRYVNLLLAKTLKLTLPDGTQLPAHEEIIIRFDPFQFQRLAQTRGYTVGAGFAVIDEMADNFTDALNDELRQFGYYVRVVVEPLYDAG